MGTPSAWQVGPCHVAVASSISIVREALVTSVTCAPPLTPPLRFQINQLSIVPKAARPSLTADATSGTCLISQSSLSAEKYWERDRTTGR